LSNSKSNYSTDMVRSIDNQVSELKSLTDQLIEAVSASESKESLDQNAKLSSETVVPLMDAVRIQADALELVVADQLWPITKYRELLYIK